MIVVKRLQEFDTMYISKKDLRNTYFEIAVSGENPTPHQPPSKSGISIVCIHQPSITYRIL